jgi:hypothetical protein
VKAFTRKNFNKKLLLIFRLVKISSSVLFLGAIFTILLLGRFWASLAGFPGEAFGDEEREDGEEDEFSNV